MSGILPSRKLVGLVLATAVLALATADLRRRGFMSPPLASAIAISLVLGFATPLRAAITLLPLGIGALLDLIHASGRPW